ncbi:MAG: hypothetical protein HY360_19870 [Verrucomicrobia bacterium]|nr:hypothetical protein [Verrucomicrobiota bacterium]
MKHSSRRTLVAVTCLLIGFHTSLRAQQVDGGQMEGGESETAIKIIGAIGGASEWGGIMEAITKKNAPTGTNLGHICEGVGNVIDTVKLYQSNDRLRTGTELGLGRLISTVGAEMIIDGAIATMVEGTLVAGKVVIAGPAIIAVTGAGVPVAGLIVGGVFLVMKGEEFAHMATNELYAQADAVKQAIARFQGDLSHYNDTDIGAHKVDQEMLNNARKKGGGFPTDFPENAKNGINNTRELQRDQISHGGFQNGQLVPRSETTTQVTVQSLSGSRLAGTIITFSTATGRTGNINAGTGAIAILSDGTIIGAGSNRFGTAILTGSVGSSGQVSLMATTSSGATANAIGQINIGSGTFSGSGSSTDPAGLGSVNGSFSLSGSRVSGSYTAQDGRRGTFRTN